MRCPYCREEIHDQALKCPHCQRLLVPKPGWQRRRERPKGRAVGGGSGSPTAVVDEAVHGPVPPRTVPPPGPVTPDGRRRARPRRGPTVFVILVTMAAAGLVGYAIGRTVTDPPVGFVSGDAERLAELEALAEERRELIVALRERLAEAAGEPPTPGQERLITALGFCNQAFTMLIDREEALFADRPALVEFVRLSNQCLAPIDQQVEIPA